MLGTPKAGAPWVSLADTSLCTGEVLDTLDTSAPVQCLEVAEHRNLLFVGLASGTVLVFPLDSRQDVGCIPPAENQKPIKAMSLTQREDQLAVASDDLVQVFNVDRGDPDLLIEQPAYTFYTQIPGAVISSLALLAGYRVLYGMTNGELFLYDCPRAQVFPLVGHSCNITCLKTSHGEQWAVSGSADSLQRLWDVELCSWEHEMLFQKVVSLLLVFYINLREHANWCQSWPGGFGGIGE